MANPEFQQEFDTTQVPYPNLPPLLESRATEYHGTGVTSSVNILGHPIHPIIVIFPVAFLSGTAGADIGYWLTQDPFWARASMWLIGLGASAGILAGIIGMVDFLRIPRVRHRTAGWAHMVANILALVLSLINFGLRLNDPATTIVPVGLTLSLVVATLLLIGGWFGGELTFRHKIGVIGSGKTQTSV
jgi:uncharacterized membrane protein